MPLTIFSQRELAEIRRDTRLENPTDWFRRTYFGATPFFSDNKEIAFAKIAGTRQMAPFAQPSHMGKPIERHLGLSVDTFTPAYIKLLNAVRPEDATSLTPEEVLTGERLDMQTRFDLRTTEVSELHLTSIYRTWDWMCARAVIDGAVTVKYDQEQGMPNPEVTISFGRDANLTVAYSGGIDWSSASHDILGDLSDWINLGRAAQFGGSFNNLILGANVVAPFMANNQIKDLLDTNYRGGEGTSFQRGLVVTGMGDDNNTPVYMGRIGGTGGALDVWTYRDQQLTDTGSTVEMLNPDDIFMSAPGVNGLMAFGAIYDVQASAAGIRTDIFQKQYEVPNPSAINMLTQSAPLPIPRFPNRTFKATVLTP